MKALNKIFILLAVFNQLEASKCNKCCLSGRNICDNSISESKLITSSSIENEPNTTVRRDQNGNIEVNTINVERNINLVSPSTATSGNLLKSNQPFLHNFQAGITPDSANSSDQVFLGFDSGNFVMTGTGNTGVGTETLFENLSGSFNTAMGAHALSSNTTGGVNSAFGQNALKDNTDGSANAAFGVSALALNTTGDNNTGIGTDSLRSNTIGSNNVGLGYQSGVNMQTGDNNLFLGASAGSNLTSGSNTIYIANSGIASEDRTIRIGAPLTHQQTFIAGINNVNVGASGTQVFINNLGQLGTVASSRRYKENIAPLTKESEKIYELEPVKFTYKDDSNQKTQFGLIAEDVAQVKPELVHYNEKGQPQTVHYQMLIPLLLNEIKKLQKRVSHLEEKRK